MKGTVKEILFELRRNYEVMRDGYEKVILGMDEELKKKDAEIEKLKTDG